MSIAVSNAISGMRTAGLRLEASARNVASAGTAKTAPSTRAGGPVYLLVRVDQAAPAGQTGPPAVATASVRNSAPVWMAAYQDEVSTVIAAADVDLAAEALEQASARASFMANAKTLQVSQEMVRRLFELAG